MMGFKIDHCQGRLCAGFVASRPEHRPVGGGPGATEDGDGGGAASLFDPQRGVVPSKSDFKVCRREYFMSSRG